MKNVDRRPVASRWAGYFLFLVGALAVTDAPSTNAGTIDAALAPSSGPYDKAWGPLAGLAGTAWRSEQPEAVITYRWIQPGTILKVITITPSDKSAATMKLDSSGIINAELAYEDGRRLRMTVSSPSATEFTAELPDLLMRGTSRVDGQVITQTVEQLKHGRWVAVVTVTAREVRGAAAAEMISSAEASFKPQALVAASASDALADAWGPLAELVGAYWRGPQQIWAAGWVKPGEEFILAKFSPEGALQSFLLFTLAKNGQLQVQTPNNSFADKVAILKDGSIYVTHLGHRLSRVSVEEFDWSPGSLAGNNFVPAAAGTTAASGRYRLLEAAEMLAFDRMVEARKEESRIAELHRKSQGDSGLFGALAAGLGAAMAGRNAESANPSR